MNNKIHKKILIVSANYYKEISKSLVKGATNHFEKNDEHYVIYYQ